MSDTNASSPANEAVNQFEIQAVNFGYRFIKDSNVRRIYMERTKEYADSLKQMLAAREITPREAAKMANEMRNEIMEWARAKSSDIGRAKARALKAKGLDLDALLEKYAAKAYNKPFAELTAAEKDVVYVKIVDASGRANPKVSARAAKLGKAGRVLWLISLGVAAYNIGTAEDKARATGREVAGISGGFAGGAAGGAIAGIWAGPVGVAVGAAIGGLIGGIVADQVYIEASSANDRFVQKLIDPHTSVVSTDEAAIANALIKECGYEMDKVFAVFKELDWAYTSDADDVALEYVKKLKNAPQLVKLAFKGHQRLRNLLIDILDEGWTTGDEKSAMAYIRNM